MPQNVQMIAKNKRKESLPKIANLREDFSSVVLEEINGNVMSADIAVPSQCAQSLQAGCLLNSN